MVFWLMSRNWLVVVCSRCWLCEMRISVLLNWVSVIVNVLCVLRFRWLVGLLSSSRLGCC